jgi:hypothetical protein
LLSENLQEKTYIPEYILRAIAFAANHISQDAIKHMGLFRISKFDTEDNSKFPKNSELEVMSPKKFIGLFKKIVPGDDLSNFDDYLKEYH